MKDFKNIAIVIIAALLLIAGLHYFLPHDTTDDPDGGRSGLSLYTDALTGCQYIRVGLFSTLVPRLDENGGHICKGDEQRWLDFRAKQEREYDRIAEKEAAWLRLTPAQRQAQSEAKERDRREAEETIARIKAEYKKKKADEEAAKHKHLQELLDKALGK